MEIKMTEAERGILIKGGVDVDGAIYRFGGNESIYISCLSDFLDDDSMADYRRFSGEGDWDGAYTAVHTLKGLAGNMGFNDLMHAASRTVSLVREGRTQAASESNAALSDSYNAVAAVVREFFAAGKRTDSI